MSDYRKEHVIGTLIAGAIIGAIIGLILMVYKPLKPPPLPARYTADQLTWKDVGIEIPPDCLLHGGGDRPVDIPIECMLLYESRPIVMTYISEAGCTKRAAHVHAGLQWQSIKGTGLCVLWKSEQTNGEK